MAYSLINVITVLIGIGFLLTGYRMVKRGRENVAMFILSAIIGLGLVLAGVFPDLFQFIARIVGFDLEDPSRGRSRAIFVVSNLTLFGLVIYLLKRLGELKGKISRLNEELSLLKTQFEESRDD